MGHGSGCVGTFFGAGFEEGAALSTVFAIVGVGAIADGGPESGSAEGLIVDNHGEFVARVHDFGEVAIVGIGGVGLDDLFGVGVAAGGEFDDADVRFVARQIFWANPDGAEEVFIIAALVVGAATEDGKVELGARGGLSHTVMAVEIVMELVEGAIAEAAGVRLEAHHFAVGLGPGGEGFDVVERAVFIASGVEFVVEFVHIFESDFACDIHIDGEADFDLWEALADDGGDEW